MYDVIIIGAGPAGLSAAIYAARYKMKTLVLGKELGGYAAIAHKIENYPGFQVISGKELVDKMIEQVKKLGVEIKNEEVKNIEKRGKNFAVETDKKYESKAIILALGTEKQKIGLKNEDKFVGKGLSYCTTCDAPFFKNKDVIVVGGSNSAVFAALMLSEFGKKVYLVYRGSELRADPIRVEELKKNKKVEIIFNAQVKEINGKDKVESISLNNGKKLNVQGIFVEIGSVPKSLIAKSLGIKLDEKGYILVNEKMETNVQGIFAAGDVIKKDLRQIITACSDGAKAAHSAYNAKSL